MPNHITNEVTVIGGTNKERAAFIRSVTNKYGRIDFNNITRMPKSMHIDESSDVEMMASAIAGKPMADFYFGDVMDIAEVTEKLRLRGSKSSYIKKVIQQAHLRVDNKSRYGFYSWYDWSRMKWGTKWNAYDVEMPIPEVKERVKLGYRHRKTHVTAYAKRLFKKRLNRHAESGAELQIRFDTAWASPDPIFEEMAKSFPHLEFQIRYADEDTGSNCGQYHIKGDLIHSSDIAPRWGDQSPDEKRKWTEFAFKLTRPDVDPKEYGYNENWEYIEE
ncbi:hypothetical protein HA48_14695 [Pantoea wallisii]|uniref:YubB ferredoxin-like domain-containing protein n=1 Tax=Pantoea wallisii TaxID=1076551 RepID=A0A1X1D7B2_9GAMM|nr:hypothetical protein [Pantoea wallisii]ORM72401.1 hypothetical protein HA48_14695 [Pantoea wallisii]